MLNCAMLLVTSGALMPAMAQTASQSSTQNAAPATSATAKAAAASPATQPSDQMVVVSGPPQPTLADLARAAREKKTESKAARVINDDNMAATLFSSGKGDISIVGSGGSSRGGPRSGGRFTLYDFWATWCGPCRDAVPHLKQFQANYAGRIDVISVNEDDNEQAWSEFVSRNGMNWEQKFDGDRELARRYGVNAFPTYVLVGPSGSVIQRWTGDDPSTPLAVRFNIQSVLGGTF
jgi:thiol-disulfide isomerase/thioredoxin